MSTPTRPAPARADAVPVLRRPQPGLRTLVVLVADGLRRHRRTALTWGGALGLMSALMVAIWPSIGDQMDELLVTYPDAIKEAFGIRSLDTAERYVDAEMLSMIVPFALALLAIRCVVGPTAGAEERGELETTLAAPVDRWAVGVAAVVVAGLVGGATLLVVWALTCAGSLVAGAGADVLVLGRGFLNAWPLTLVAAGLALLVAGRRRGAGLVTGVAAGAFVAMYVLDLAGRLAPDLDAVRTVSAFAYYGSAIQDGLDLGHVLVLLGAAAVLTLAGALGLQRRDLG